MKKGEYNKLLDKKYNEFLKYEGFRKLGIHMYLYDPPTIMFVRNGWRFSDELVFAYTFDFLPFTKDENGKIKISKRLSDYPISIPAVVLKQQYNSHKEIFKFRYDLNFMTREMFVSRRLSTYDIAYVFRFGAKEKTQKYIDFATEILMNEGLKFKNEFSLEVAYNAMNKFKDEDSIPELSANNLTNRFNLLKESIKSKLLEQGRELPIRNPGFIERWQLKRYYKWLEKIKMKKDR